VINSIDIDHFNQLDAIWYFHEKWNEIKHIKGTKSPLCSVEFASPFYL